MNTINIELNDPTFLKLSKRAHELNIPLNDLVNKIISDVINQEEDLECSVNDDSVKSEKKNLTKPPFKTESTFRPPMSDNRQDVPIVNKWVDPKYKHTTNSWKF